MFIIDWCNSNQGFIQTILGAIIAIWGILGWRAAYRQANIMRSDFELNSRPWIGLSATKIDPITTSPEGNLVRIHFHMKNFGKLPGEITGNNIEIRNINPATSLKSKEIRNYKKLCLLPEEAMALNSIEVPEKDAFMAFLTVKYKIPGGQKEFLAYYEIEVISPYDSLEILDTKLK